MKGGTGDQSKEKFGATGDRDGRDKDKDKDKSKGQASKDFDRDGDDNKDRNKGKPKTFGAPGGPDRASKATGDWRRSRKQKKTSARRAVLAARPVQTGQAR